MQRLSDLWEAYLNSGSRHFTTATELKHNRVLNLLYALSFFANVFLIVAELAVFAILLQRDFDRYISYFWPFAAINAVFPLLMGAVLYMKNKYGTFRITYLSTLFYTVYCTLLSVFLGERIGIHLILLTVMPIVYVMYDFGRWKEISIHTAIMAVGLVTALASYRLSPPVYPIPDDLTTVGGYLCWGAAIALLFGYSTYNWKQVHLTERQLANEKAQTEGLLRETIPRLEIAEAKYRHLVDDSSDMIFQMNETGEILSMNKTAHALLGFAPEEMVGRRLYDIELNRNIVREHVRLFLEEKTLVNFRTTLRKKHMYEPVDLSVTLQKNLIHWQVEILGKASRLQEDVSQRFLEKEKGQYRITNNVTHAEILSQKICERLNRGEYDTHLFSRNSHQRNRTR